MLIFQMLVFIISIYSMRFNEKIIFLIYGQCPALQIATGLPMINLLFRLLLQWLFFSFDHCADETEHKTHRHTHKEGVDAHIYGLGGKYANGAANLCR